ncbi:MAG: hypothetical protein RR847_04345 [Bacilli bacterium]
MKNAINYYYNLLPNNIHQRNKEFFFNVGVDNFILKPINKELNDINNLYEITLNLLRQNVYTHQFIFNKNNNLITLINEKWYVVLKVYITNKRKIVVNDIVFFSQIIINMDSLKIKRDSWYVLWSKKIDYLEYQVSQLGKKFPLIRESFSYFVGLSENAISLVRDINNIDLKVAHKRIIKSNSLFDLYDPFNFVIDTRIRDICEYFKSCFFEGDDVFTDIKLYVESSQLTVNECLLFLGRMFYPTFYFDIYEDILLGQNKEKQLLKIINRISDYEILLQEIYSYLKRLMMIPEIEWIASLR